MFLKQPPRNDRGVFYRVHTDAFRVRTDAEAYLDEVQAAGLDAYIPAQTISEVQDKPEGYTLKQFVLDIQTAVGAAADGIGGSETLRKLPTISRLVNRTHAAAALQQLLTF